MTDCAKELAVLEIARSIAAYPPASNKHYGKAGGARQAYVDWNLIFSLRSALESLDRRSRSKVPRTPTGDQIYNVCRYLAWLSDGLARSAGTPGLENAGWYVSICATDPSFAQAVSERGASAVIDDPSKFNPMTNGCLSYRAANGQILYPSEARTLSGKADN